jgi:hypothetical protein
MIEYDCTGGWSRAMTGQLRVVPYGPDTYATYWFYAFVRKPGDAFGIRFSGQYAHARFTSFNVYDAVGDLINPPGGPRSSLLDTDIEPDPGSLNPFRLAVDRATPDRAYTLLVVPEGSPTGDAPNVITFPDSATLVSVYLRVYVPDPDLAGRYRLQGGVPLPAIEAFVPATGERYPCPQQVLGQDSQGGKDLLPPANHDGEVRFYRNSADGYYPNGDAAYLYSLFDPPGDSVAVIRMKQPTVTHTDRSGGILGATPMVRYWSFNVYTELTTATACLPDFQARPDEHGVVTLVLARPHPEVIRKVEEEGWNFLPWSPLSHLAEAGDLPPLLQDKDPQTVAVVYRNLVANPAFAWSTWAVPQYDPALPAEPQSAGYFMGEYAPQGTYCSVEEFLGAGVPAAV